MRIVPFMLHHSVVIDPTDAVRAWLIATFEQKATASKDRVIVNGVTANELKRRIDALDISSAQSNLDAKELAVFRTWLDSLDRSGLQRVLVGVMDALSHATPQWSPEIVRWVKSELTSTNRPVTRFGIGYAHLAMNPTINGLKVEVSDRLILADSRLAACLLVPGDVWIDNSRVPLYVVTRDKVPVLLASRLSTDTELPRDITQSDITAVKMRLEEVQREFTVIPQREAVVQDGNRFALLEYVGDKETNEPPKPFNTDGSRFERILEDE